jgi:thioredoxin
LIQLNGSARALPATQLRPDQIMVQIRHRLRSPVVLAVGALLSWSGCQQQESIPKVEGIEVTMNDENFQTEALESETPVLVDFGATWCGPCRQMEPALAYLSVQYKDRVKVGKVDVDESTRIAADYSIESLPTFAIFQDGVELARAEGSMSYKELSSWLDQHVSQ